MPNSRRAFAVRCVGVGLTLTALAGCSTAHPDRFEPNDNRVAAGTLREGVLTLHLEARDATWYPDGNAGPSRVVPMFAEGGRPAQIPGPLSRVPAGPPLPVSVRTSRGADTLGVYGRTSRPGRLDEFRVGAQAADREVVQRSRCLDAVIRAGRHGVLAERIAFGAGVH